MSSALLTGYQEKTPPPVPLTPAAPTTTVVAAPVFGCGGAGCGGCGDVCGAGSPSGCSDPNPMAKTGILARLKSPFKRLGKSDDCGCASAPVFTGFTTAACDTCGDTGNSGLLSKLKAKFHTTFSSSSNSCSSGGCAMSSCGAGGCALPAIPGGAMMTPPVTSPTPMPMQMPPKDEKDKKEAGKDGAAKITTPALTPVAVPAVPALGGSTSPY